MSPPAPPEQRAPSHLPAGDLHSGGEALGGLIGRVTTSLALAGGALLLVAMAITLVSVVGRYSFGRPVPGDYELVEIICAIGIFLFLPYTHASNGNISALFFTSGLPLRYQRALDVTHDVIFTLVAALLTWRLAAGLADKFATGETSIMIRIPFWWAYTFAVLAMALLTVVCIGRVAKAVAVLRS